MLLTKSDMEIMKVCKRHIRYGVSVYGFCNVLPAAVISITHVLPATLHAPNRRHNLHVIISLNKSICGET